MDCRLDIDPNVIKMEDDRSKSFLKRRGTGLEVLNHCFTGTWAVSYPYLLENVGGQKGEKAGETNEPKGLSYNRE